MQAHRWSTKIYCANLPFTAICCQNLNSALYCQDLKRWIKKLMVALIVYPFTGTEVILYGMNPKNTVDKLSSDADFLQENNCFNWFLVFGELWQTLVSSMITEWYKNSFILRLNNVKHSWEDATRSHSVLPSCRNLSNNEVITENWGHRRYLLLSKSMSFSI